jgi:LysM repeat protein
MPWRLPFLLAMGVLCALAAPRRVAAETLEAQPAVGSDGEAHAKSVPASASASESVSASESESDPEDELSEGAAQPPLRRTEPELDDAELERRWVSDPASLGSLSLGLAEQGRVINAVQLGEDPAWTRQRPDLAWGVQETIDGLAAAFRAVRAQFPDSPPARLSHVGAREGGKLHPHRTHQSGRDADVGLFYRTDRRSRGGRWERRVDPARNWALIKALVTLADVQVILVDRRIQAVLRDHALKVGEDRAWVDRIFRGGRQALVQHARHHRDHFHVRFFAPRSQELGRRILPLLAKRPDQNVALHTVKRGQTLGHLARTYRTSVAAILRQNHMRLSALHVGQQLRIPLRGPCTRCPVPPPLVLPPRCLPPGLELAQAGAKVAARPATVVASAEQPVEGGSAPVQPPAPANVAPTDVAPSAAVPPNVAPAAEVEQAE